jgi:hypothetical protein
MAEQYELRVLADYLGGAQAVNTWQHPTPAAVNGEIETDERGEVVFAEIWPPVTPAGVEEELRKVTISLDGKETDAYVSLSGIRATNMAPPQDRIWAGRLYSFGSPHNPNPLLNTTLKYKQNVTVNTLAGPTVAITQPFRVRLWGYVYKTGDIPGAFGAMAMQFPTTLREVARNRQIALNKTLPINGDTWLTLPGGKDQAIPKINPFVRYAYNLLATNGQQGDFQLRYKTGQVLEADEDMYFEFDEKDALFVEGLGVKADPAPGHLARMGLIIGGNYHPKGPTNLTSLFPATPGINPKNFGFMFPSVLPNNLQLYAAIPKLERPYLIWNEIGGVIIRDDGLGAVAANAVVAALSGIRIEMRG